jgi:fructose transport system ATP-binding protein
VEARLNGIETVYQDLALANDLGVVENIFLGREYCKMKLGPLSILNHRKMKKQAAEMLDETGIKIQNLEVPISNLSGGQRQGVAIARAAGWGSNLILLDEPTAALGVQETKRVEEIIRKLKKNGIAALMISHNLTQVFSLSDEIWVLRHGKMVGHRTTKESEPREIVSMITGADTLYA